jgi:hypothetical protein
MFDSSDLAALAMLDRSIRRVLEGDDKSNGLYYALRSCTNWDGYQRLCGRIEGYEALQAEVQRIRRIINGDPPEQPMHAPRVN